jgi:hypothetical protein
MTNERTKYLALRPPACGFPLALSSFFFLRKWVTGNPREREVLPL